MTTYRTGVGVYAFQNWSFGTIGSPSDVASQVTANVTQSPHIPHLYEQARVIDPLDFDTLMTLRPRQGEQGVEEVVPPSGIKRRRTRKGVGR